MPSAQKVENNEPPREQAEPDLHSLLQEIHTSTISKLNSLHRRGTVLFSEGEPAHGVYILRAGRATVSISSSEGRVVILRMVHPGDVLGLNAALQNSTYEMTVKTLEPCRTEFIPRAQLMALIDTSDTAKRAVLKILSRELTQLTNRTRSLLLPPTANAKLARLLLEWSRENHGSNSQNHGSNSHGSRVDKLFTHEDISQMICSSRETVTRLLATFSRRDIIRITPDSILINDPDALEQIIM